MTPRPKNLTSRPAPVAARKRRATTAPPKPAAAAEKPAAIRDRADWTESFLPVTVAAVEMTLPNPNPILVLEEVDAPHRRIAIPIGVSEGTAIAYSLKGLSTPKPLVHELFAQTLSVLDAQVAAARITASDAGAFYAEIVLSATNGQHTLACRPSDAVGVALRQRPPAPIVASSRVLDRAAAEASGS